VALVAGSVAGGGQVVGDGEVVGEAESEGQGSGAGDDVDGEVLGELEVVDVVGVPGVEVGDGSVVVGVSVGLGVEVSVPDGDVVDDVLLDGVPVAEDVVVEDAADEGLVEVAVRVVVNGDPDEVEGRGVGCDRSTPLGEVPGVPGFTPISVGGAAGDLGGVGRTGTVSAPGRTGRTGGVMPRR
jgi:hypothetical protein